jgi:hypothetical protein
VYVLYYVTFKLISMLGFLADELVCGPRKPLAVGHIVSNPGFKINIEKSTNHSVPQY